MPISPPTKITVPFATSGLKNAIPANTNNVTGNAGYDAGFGAINMTPKTAGGIPPFGQDFNGIFFDVTTALQFLEAGGSFPFDSAFATAVGGYPIGAVVSRSDNSGLWRNTVANNTVDPEGAGTGWQPEDAGNTAVTMTNANVTLTKLQSARSIITITGVLTANLNLILPTYSKQWTIANNCTGAFVITVKTAAGSGVVSRPGSVQFVYGDGTNIVSAATGRLLNIQYIIATGTYTPTAGTNFVEVELIGGGAAGGGVPAPGAGNVSAAPGGGGGGGSRKLILSGFSGVTVTIGAGGAGASNAAGGNGGNTSFGAIFSATGGTGGAVGPVILSTAQPVAFGIGTGGSGVGGDANFQGGIGNYAFISGSPTSGKGGSTQLGEGARYVGGTSNGINGGPNTGNGGSGASAAPSGVAGTGGSGGTGLCIVREYA